VKHTAEFVISAADESQFPRDGLPETAFLGRSNVGKSSLINRLLGVKGLAFTSARPGCTQTINFYRIDGAFYFVDLPGYGYAEVSRDTSHAWKQLIDSYLKARQTLDLSVIVLDARRGWMEKDIELKSWLQFHHRQYLVVATKVDKLKTQSERQQSLQSLRQGEQEPLLFSAETGRGVREIWQAISKTHHNR
jgi:GTP-binding protein